MSVIFAVLFIFAFFVFIAIGFIAHFHKSAKKWLYFILSAFGLLGTILMFSVYNWDLGIGEKAASPKVIDINEKKPAEQKAPEQKIQTGTDEESPPANQTSPIPPPAPTPSGPTEQKQNQQTKIVVPTDGAINYRK